MTTSCTFKVSDVKPGVYGERYYDDVPCSAEESSPRTASLKSVIEAQFKGVVACCEPEVMLIAPGRYENGGHALLYAAHTAFDRHYPLVLSPDILWISIVQGFAQHVGLHAEEYRKCFVQHEGTKRLEYWSDFEPGTPSLPWEQVIEIFSGLTRQEIGPDTHGLIVADFSTTGPVEKTVSEVALLDAMKCYFEYYGGTRCGIPEVTLEGTTEDWEKLARKVKGLAAYGGLNWWLDKVSVIADQCIAASQGNVDKSFWTSLYKIDNMSGGPYVNGWITHLVPYLTNPETKKIDVPNHTLTNGPEAEHSWGGGGINPALLPKSVSQVPFIWNYYGKEVNYEFLGGSFGVEHNPQTLSVRPKVAWAIRLADPSNA